MEPYVKTKPMTQEMSFQYFTKVDNTNPTMNVDNIYRTSWEDSLSGWKNPRWRDAVRNHTSAGTSLTASRIVYKARRTDHSITYRPMDDPNGMKVQRRVSGFVDLPFLQTTAFTPPDTHVAFVSNRCLSRFYKNAWSKLRFLQGGVLLGELRETFSMLRNPGKALRRGIDDYVFTARRRARKSDPKRRQEILADTWLEYVFGWSPLLGDIKDAAEAFAENFNRVRLDVEKVRAREILEHDATTTTSEVTTFYQTFDRTDKQKFKTECRIIGEVGVRTDPVQQFDKALFGFTWNDFVPTVWELIPYSFLVDYFTNIGDVLESVSFPTGAIRWHNRTVRKSCEVDYTYLRKQRVGSIIFGNQTIIDVNGTMLPFHGTVSHVSRDQTVLGLPYLAFEIPGLGSQKWLNIAALAKLRVL